ncbi:DnaJ C-terminal domain-containing protein, partial [Streptosporangium algeriense]
MRATQTATSSAALDESPAPCGTSPSTTRSARKTLTVGGRRIEVRIPAGVTDGRRIRLAGQGGRGGDGAPPGDLYLIVRIAPHPRYRVEGRDIHLRLPITPWEGALGAAVAVETPGGETKVKVPP